MLGNVPQSRHNSTPALHQFLDVQIFNVYCEKKGYSADQVKYGLSSRAPWVEHLRWQHAGASCMQCLLLLPHDPFVHAGSSSTESICRPHRKCLRCVPGCHAFDLEHLGGEWMVILLY